MSEETIRINKFLSQSGYCSRREADGLITQERVLINGKMATMGQQVGPKDQILVDGEVLQNKSNKRKIYLAFHKPKGIVCTTDTRVEKDNIIDFINYPERIFSDKTQWRKMVQNQSETIDWPTEIHRALAQLPEEVKPYIVQPVETPKNISYPMEGQYPLKPTSLNLSKNPTYSGKLIGIKGQYLLFEDQTVFNVRSNEGQVVTLKIKPKA
tara:strand:+ start:190 stop:822 length:633 start_codon:yes stop_codon:yes gene_type:complete